MYIVYNISYNFFINKIKSIKEVINIIHKSPITVKKVKFYINFETKIIYKVYNFRSGL